MHNHYLSEGGQLWTEYDLHNALKCSLSGSALRDFAIFNLGMIALRPIRHGHEIRLCQRTVAIPALIGLIYWLSDTPSGRRVLTVTDVEASHTLVRSGARLLPDVVALLGERERQCEQRGAHFLARPVVATESPFFALAATSRLVAAEVRDLTALSNIFDQLLGGRFTLVDVGEAIDAFKVCAIGGGFEYLAREWMARAKGRVFTEHEDPAYGAWCSLAHQRASAESEATFEDVDVRIMRGAYGRVRARYSRMIVPLWSGTKRPLLLSASLVRPEIDLRRAIG